MAKKKKKKGFDVDEHIAQLREILSEPPTPQTWRQLLEHVASIPEEAADERTMIIDYAESNVEQWAEELRVPLYTWWKAKQQEEEREEFRLIGNFTGQPLLTVKDIETLAPDRRAFTATKGIAKLPKWKEMGRDKGILWGTAFGSSDEYAIWVNILTHSFECSCPSRKRPCKHALGLPLMDANGIDIPEKEAPSDHQWEAEESSYSSWE